MRDVSIIGTAMSQFGRFPGLDYAGLAAPVVLDALADAGAQPDDIQATYCGHSYGGMLTGQRILKTLGMTGPPVLNVENACSSGAAALHEAWQAISAGIYDVALVIGVDKLTQFNGGPLPLVMEDWEVAGGMMMPSIYAMRAQRYLHEFDATVNDLADVAVKARKHGALNPKAQLQSEVTAEQVLASRPVSDPFTLFQCCPTGDGAAAVIVCATEVADRFSPQGAPVRILASVLESGIFQSGFRDMTVPEITVRSAAMAYAEAGITATDLDVLEVHDAFSIAELLYYESFGLCERGDAIDLLHSGATSLGGDHVVNPSGGLLSKGHPIGASGAAQVYEIVHQLQGRAGDRQVADAKIGLTHVTGGGLWGLDSGACSVHVLARS